MRHVPGPSSCTRWPTCYSPRTERSIKAGEGEAAANILQLAARALETQSWWLASERMEQAIQALAATLSFAASAAQIQPAGVRRLHVLNRALPYGGHTAMAARWMTSGETGEIMMSCALPARTGAGHPSPGSGGNGGADQRPGSGKPNPGARRRIAPHRARESGDQCRSPCGHP